MPACVALPGNTGALIVQENTNIAETFTQKSFPHVTFKCVKAE